MKLRIKTAAACALLMGIAAAAIAVQPVSAAAASQEALAAYASEVVTLVNEERAIYGLKPVREAPALDRAAQLRAEETVRQFSHTRPDGRGSATVLEDMAIEWRTCGENIAYGYKDAEAVMDGWMHSDGHRANILNTDFEYIGVGVTERGGVIYCTQVFTGGAVLETADTPQYTTPVEIEAPAEIPLPVMPCIGDACDPECKDGDCTVPQTICIGGNCLTLPQSACPAQNALTSVLGGNCNAADLLGLLTSCRK